MTPDVSFFRGLFRYNEWANGRALDAAACAAPADFIHDLGPFQGSLRDTLTHIAWSEWIWLQRWRGVTPLVFQPADFDRAPKDLVFEPADFADVDALRDRFLAVAADTQNFLMSLTGERLAEVPPYELLDGSPFHRPLWRQLHHAVNHSTYHRGQVAMMLRRLGHVPASTDFVAFSG